jgi:bacterial/archaeal transporter family protein
VTWLIAVLLSTMFFAWVTVLDKKLVTDLFPSMQDFYLVFGLMQFVIGPAIMAIAWANGGFGGIEGIAWSLGTGVTFVVALWLFFYGLKLEDASRAAPLQSLSTVFATLIAVVLLGETLTPVQGVAVAVVVAGAALVSMRRENGAFRLARGRALLALVASALGLGIAFVVTKQATDHASVWAVQGVSTLVLGVLTVAVVGRRDRFAGIPALVCDRHLVGVMLLTEGVLAPAAVGTLMLAFTLGTVSLVSVVAASRPLLVLIISAGLSTRVWNVLHEPLDRETLGLKAFSTLLIVGGVATLAAS